MKKGFLFISVSSQHKQKKITYRLIWDNTSMNTIKLNIYVEPIRDYHDLTLKNQSI